MRRLVSALLLVGAICIGGVVTAASPAGAHPLGNFSVNHYAELTVSPDVVRALLVVDLAEIPTFQLKGTIDRDGDGALNEPELSSHAAAACAAAADGARLMVDGRREALSVREATASLAPGSADLPVLRVACSTSTRDLDLGSGTTALEFRNQSIGDRAGWHEVVARGDGMRLVRSDVPSRSVSAALTRYPEDQLAAPLDVRSARLSVTPGGAAAASEGSETGVAAVVPNQLDAAAERLVALVARPLTLPLALAALALALVLGALHAFAPGHGKTVIAAYLVTERGSFRHAALIGLCVTATHTAGVLLLGLVLTTWTAFAPERLYPVLGIASGVMLASIGVLLVRRALQRRRAHSHSLSHHEHGHGHSHDPDHEHDHDPALHQHGGSWHRHPEITSETRIGWRSLAVMGVAGGLVPSPSALVVLLGATALGRAWFGAVLVVAYGAGMAVTLIAAGALLTRTRHLFDRAGRTNARLRWGSTVLPIATSAFIVVLGCSLAARSVLTL